VCLIPGDEPVVRVEDAPGNARRIFTGVDIRATVDEVWRVMTDYELLQQRVPNLVQNQVLERYRDGGARLRQVGRASWRVLGRDFFFQAMTVLDVHLHPEGLPQDKLAGADMDASTSAEVREYDRNLPLVRGVFPRPFSISVKDIPMRDISMENVEGMRGDFVHYRGVWRFQPLDSCGAPGEDMMRLTFSVECEPNWWLPVAPVESRIAVAMVENMSAIRTYVEENYSRRESKRPAGTLGGVGLAGVSNVLLADEAPDVLDAIDAPDATPMYSWGASEEEILDTVWRAVLEQHPEAVREQTFLGMPLAKSDVERRWPRLVQTLGVSEEQALEIVQTDVTPLLVESADIAEILSRLAAISSRENALELIGWNPSLLVGGAAGKRGKRLGISTLVDVLYAGRIVQVLDEDDRDDADKLEEIRLYSALISALKPIVDATKHGISPKVGQRLWSAPLQSVARFLPSQALRIFLFRLTQAPNPIAFLAWQTKAGLSVVNLLVREPSLALSIFSHSPSILPHIPSIYTRLSVLEPHVPAIVRILDPYLLVVKPHLDRIMERMDEIEPHLPYILLHLDTLAQHCGKLLDHFDELLPFASTGPSEEDRNDVVACNSRSGTKSAQLEDCMVERWMLRSQSEVEQKTRQRSYLPLLLPYVDFLVQRIDDLSPHLAPIRPHLPYVIPYMDTLLPYIDRFIEYPVASKNADVLIGYLGWIFRVPVVPRVLYLPLVPKFVAKLSTILPRWPIRRMLAHRRRCFDKEYGRSMPAVARVQKSVCRSPQRRLERQSRDLRSTDT